MPRPSGPNQQASPLPHLQGPSQQEQYKVKADLEEQERKGMRAASSAIAKGAVRKDDVDLDNLTLRQVLEGAQRF